MSKSLIQLANTSTQAIEENGIISLGNIIRRYGCDCQLVGNTVSLNSEGYYEVDAAVTVVPTEAGVVTVTLYEDGVAVPGAVSSMYATTAAQPVTIPIVTTIRRFCNCCSGPANLSLVLESGAGNVTNVSLRVKKS